MTIPRKEFVKDYFDYKPGEHVVFAGPTQRGKTTLAFQLLQVTSSPDLPAYVIVVKPRDPTVSEWAKKLHYRVIHEWPPPPSLKHSKLMGKKVSGYVIWPRLGDIYKDPIVLQDVHRRMMADRYTSAVRGKKSIIMADETLALSKELKLDTEMRGILTRGGAMDCGIWVFVQKPTASGETSVWAYGNSEHLFLFRDPDARNRQRFDEIGGVDPGEVDEITMKLDPYQALYIKRTGPMMCIVDKD